MSIEVGAWNKLPHYSLKGGPLKFYVWVNEDGGGEASRWIEGRFNLYHDLKNLHRKHKKMFVVKVKELLVENKKGGKL